MDPKGNLIW